ncbi:tRNA modification GTPase MnmE [Planctomycetes bacterium MalM25]|nr:tRNA modification GTPase MnmE [Planctomycetes bacterium MalM25]
MTRVRLLTPAGRGAIAVVEVRGDDAAQRVDRWFDPAFGSSLSQRAINQIVFGRWRANRGGEPGDEPAGEELVAVRTADDRVEVHCHGGVAASRAVVLALVADGAEQNESGTLATIEQAARSALSEAPTERTASVLLDQLNGALARTIETVVTFLGANDHEMAAAQLETLLERERLGQHLTTPWRVVLAGPPNVGKSRLINALVGYARAIVFDQPGTTRDVVTAATVIDGWPVTLADTAGVRDASDPLEAAGVRLALGTLSRADVVVRVSEADGYESSEAHASRERLAEAIPDAATLIDVASKADLAPENNTPAGVLRVASPTGEGVQELLAAIADAFAVGDPAGGEAVPFAPSQIAALRLALGAIAGDDAVAAAETLRALLADGKA